ncbi:hypothetical protein E2C01_070591 [Portunus trituberculatus]|uniref:Uncharacterized protein n=1 Tax=Portunus trituberculatus TaxID=210409 RepID=A0A5B7I211_PORTR|nr:hypothetical protein [Portunus trituberculatus]
MAEAATQGEPRGEVERGYLVLSKGKVVVSAINKKMSPIGVVAFLTLLVQVRR